MDWFVIGFLLIVDNDMKFGFCLVYVVVDCM